MVVTLGAWLYVTNVINTERNRPQTETTYALDITDVCHHYGNIKALADIDLKIQNGEFMILLGPNGAGKTTLFSLITRLHQQSSGEVHINGFNLSKNPQRALAQLGVVFQQRSLDLDLTVEQNLKYSATLYGLSHKQRQRALDLELERVKMQPYKDARVRSLSGGQARRVEIARALMSNPKLLILDEATVGLDVSSRELLLRHVRSLCKQGKLAVLWTTHLIDEVEAEDSVTILKKGRIISRGKAYELAASRDLEKIRKAIEVLVT